MHEVFIANNIGSGCVGPMTCHPLSMRVLVIARLARWRSQAMLEHASSRHPLTLQLDASADLASVLNHFPSP
jgi:hypothetical protein